FYANMQQGILYYSLWGTSQEKKLAGGDKGIRSAIHDYAGDLYINRIQTATHGSPDSLRPIRGTNQNFKPASLIDLSPKSLPAKPQNPKYNVSDSKEESQGHRTLMLRPRIDYPASYARNLTDKEIGTILNLAQNQRTIRGEWRNIGYTAGGHMITNPFFPRDVSTVSTFSERNWIKTPWEHTQTQRFIPSVSIYNTSNYKAQRNETFRAIIKELAGAESIKNFLLKMNRFIINSKGNVEREPNYNSSITEQQLIDNLADYFSVLSLRTNHIAGAIAGVHWIPDSKGNPIYRYTTMSIAAPYEKSLALMRLSIRDKQRGNPSTITRSNDFANISTTGIPGRFYPGETYVIEIDVRNRSGVDVTNPRVILDISYSADTVSDPNKRNVRIPLTYNGILRRNQTVTITHEFTFPRPNNVDATWRGETSPLLEHYRVNGRSLNDIPVILEARIDWNHHNSGLYPDDLNMSDNYLALGPIYSPDLHVNEDEVTRITDTRGNRVYTIEAGKEYVAYARVYNASRHFVVPSSVSIVNAKVTDSNGNLLNVYNTTTFTENRTLQKANG
ncbi:Athe_2463 domain-containing protein, partial [Alkalithermobacter paradoxus]|uniref:Athe_2463 domain-containing protein n=1 Tax=Alkalithermobacter paradoxus TaxID=29349 RepID=UPI002F91773C